MSKRISAFVPAAGRKAAESRESFKFWLDHRKKGVKTTVEGFLTETKAEEQVVHGNFSPRCEIENWTTVAKKCRSDACGYRK